MVRMKMKTKNLLYFLNGSIGDFLMILLVLDSVFNASGGERYNLCIFSPRNIKLFRKLSEKYPHIKIEKYPQSFWKYIFSKNIVITPPTPGVLSLHQKILGFLLARMPGSLLAGFDDGRKVNRLLYSHLESFRTDILFNDLIFSLLSAIQVPFKKNLSFRMPDACGEISDEPSVVLHPFGSSEGRSLSPEKVEKIIDILLEVFPDAEIYITGSKADALKLKNISKNSRVREVVGKLEVENLCAEIYRAKLFVGVDTGITHLASVLGKRSLVIAERGTPHWLPYYNSRATIIYAIQDDSSGVHEGREYLESKRDGRVRYLDEVPISVIEKYLRVIAHE